MTAIRIHLTDGDTTMLCEHCGDSMSRRAPDRAELLFEVREFVAVHGHCVDVRDERRP
ncbi:MAG: hypothetical protein QOI82_2557 [Actinomycetota bacterium]|jgi:hypothetical protein|nr:hypothetical protein [Actinomycetota bacterium]